MQCPFFILDVFTQKPFAGNQLAVVRECEHLSGDQMQAIAREFNFSETVFVLPPHDPVNTARLRIFSPESELPFAGHPTIGGAVLIAREDGASMLGSQELVIAVEELAGLIHCSVRKQDQRSTRAVFDLPVLPQGLDGVPPRTELARALGLRVEDIGFGEHVPSHYSAGFGFVFVPVVSADAIGRARPETSIWDEVFMHPNGRACYLYTNDIPDEDTHIRARMFTPPFGILEDPATGAAAAAFAGVCMDFEKPADGEHQIIIEQGVEMGRPSSIALTLFVRDGVLENASIGGSAVILAKGYLDL